MTKVLNQFTVGELIQGLEKFDQNELLAFCPGLYPEGFWSYRGYYEDLAIGVTTYPVKLGDWLESLKNQIGKVHCGWKGGEYVVDEETALWFAVDKSMTGPAITGVIQEDGYVKLCMPHEYWDWQ